MEWSPALWRLKETLQMPLYASDDEVARVQQEMMAREELVSFCDILSLKKALALAGRGELFVLQGGDCSERISDNHAALGKTLSLLWGGACYYKTMTAQNVLMIGRFAGQFAKPRSQENEVCHGVTLPVYRGDAINSPVFDAALRQVDPKRMLRGYDYARSCLSYVNAWHAHEDVLAYVRSYVMKAHGAKHCQAWLQHASGYQQKGRSFYSSHEALLLPYEEALVRYNQDAGVYYDSSAHFLWLGNRTSGIDGGHVEFLRGIANPIGIKCGPTMTAHDLEALLLRLNPRGEEGRITLIARMGAGMVEKVLPSLMQSVKGLGMPVVWMCDPMHGNTRLHQGVKTRYMTDVLRELTLFSQVCRAQGVIPAGIHVEATGEDIKECLDHASEEIVDSDYQTLCDPRLNVGQSLDVIAHMVHERLKV